MSTSKPQRDPRTTQFISVAVTLAVLLLVHLVSYAVAVSTQSLISGGYFFWTCVLIPLMAFCQVILLRMDGTWNWGQVVLVVIAALLFSFLQLLLFGEAMAAV